MDRQPCMYYTRNVKATLLVVCFVGHNAENGYSALQIDREMETSRHYGAINHTEIHYRKLNLKELASFQNTK